ncbi:conserved hypothetical protein [Ricinus communis]|uniref:Uncharacterized protein n=1 Tax=Ricinus communis TaxID=3988 RepID=B9TIM2_RICCO|nr:conserved hypothetical protein [Ricinus communis]
MFRRLNRAPTYLRTLPHRFSLLRHGIKPLRLMLIRPNSPQAEAQECAVSNRESPPGGVQRHHSLPLL